MEFGEIIQICVSLLAVAFSITAIICLIRRRPVKDRDENHPKRILIFRIIVFKSFVTLKLQFISMETL